MRRAALKWKHSLVWILCLCLIFGCAMAVYTWGYEEDEYCAVYTFYALAREENAGSLEASEMLAGDCQALIRTESFRERVLAYTESDGKSRLNVRGINGTHLLEVRAVGPDARIVSSLANAAGRELVNGIGELLGAREAREVTPASMPHTPIGPNRPLKVLWMAAAVFAAGSLLGALFGSDRQTLRFGDEETKTLGLPVVGAIADMQKSIGRFERQKKKRRAGGMLSEHVNRLVRESVRALVLSFRVISRSCAGNTFVITGMRGDEEKTPAAALIADEMSRQGLRVLLVEMENTCPTLAGYLGVDARADLSDYLHGRASLSEVVSRRKDSTLCFIDHLHPTEPISEIAATAGFAAFVKSAGNNFDFVLFNAAPIESGSDAAMLGMLADATVLMVKDGEYDAEELGRAANGLAGVVKRLAGVAFTMVDSQRLGL